MLDSNEHRYVLKKPLGGNGEREVFLAKDAVGREVVIKFWANDGLFFDELARHFAMDGSRYICKLLDHLPPGSVSTEMFRFEKSEAFDWNDVQYETFYETVPYRGALILEHIKGRALADVLEETPDRQKFPYLKELSQALMELHKNEEYHGDLTKENVILDASTGRIRLIDMGFFHGKKDWPLDELSPEHNPYWPHKVNQGSDVYMFARNYLGTVKKPSRHLTRLYRNCLNPDPRSRPSLEEINRKLGDPEHQVQREPEKQSGLFARGPLRWATIAYFLAASTVGIALVTDTELFEQRQAALEMVEESPDQAIGALMETRKSLQNITDYQLRINREMAIARDIAQTRRKSVANFAVKPMSQADLTRPIGVFAFPEGAAVVGHSQVFHIGDWIEVEGQEGFISRITPVELTVESQGQLKKYRFASPQFYVSPVLYDYGVILWQNPNNLSRVLDVLPKLQQTIFGDTQSHDNPLAEQLLKPGTHQLDVSQGQVAGVFSVMDLQSYASQLTDLLVLKPEGQSLNVSVADEFLPLHFRFGVFRTSGRKLSEFANDLSYYLGVDVEVAKGLEDQNLPEIETAKSTWQEVCQKLGIVWEKRENDSQLAIFIQDLNKGS